MKREDLRNVKSIEPGGGLCGPEYPGCYNTGMAAAIRHMKYRGPDKRNTNLKSVYLVGREIDLNMDYCDRIDKRLVVAAVYAGDDVVTLTNGRKVFLFCTCEEGVKKFNEMVDADIAEHDKARAEIRQARADLKSNDPDKMTAAALTLGDYGVI